MIVLFVGCLGFWVMGVKNREMGRCLEQLPWVFVSVEVEVVSREFGVQSGHLGG
ncbi:hypothetical protein HanRHA438_Chr07g0290571 [Helianthus annuus]|nr:hypothetical protein HanRHA438_Chr07g0290571 [Helianthus annuus]